MPDLAPEPRSRRHAPHAAQLLDFTRQQWTTELIPQLQDYIRVPAKSPAYDPDWEAHGLLDQVVHDGANWLRGLPIPDLEIEVLREPGRTPLLVFDAPGRGEDSDVTVLLYGHLDKQPELQGWRDGLGPWTPVFDGTRLYGRGGADDGYSLYAAATTVLALEDQAADRPRCIGIFETSEESGSHDLPYWMDRLQPKLAKLGLVVCLDSGAGDYERLWIITSLRGHCGGRLEVQVLDQAAHSGDAGGIVPSTFRLLRHLLDRVEDSSTGRLIPDAFHCSIPEERVTQAGQTAAILGEGIRGRYAWHQTSADATTLDFDPAQALLNRAWRPSLEVTGADGIPPIPDAGNVLRPRTAVKLSIRLPPTVDSRQALSSLAQTLQTETPRDATVTFEPDPVLVDGWNAPPLPAALAAALDVASAACFNGNSAAYLGQGGTIPLMNLFSARFPAVPLVACGVQGPLTNAHGPNEALHIPYTQRLTAALALTLPALLPNT